MFACRLLYVIARRSHRPRKGALFCTKENPNHVCETTIIETLAGERIEAHVLQAGCQVKLAIEAPRDVVVGAEGGTDHAPSRGGPIREYVKHASTGNLTNTRLLKFLH